MNQSNSSTDKLKKYVCRYPFEYLDIQSGSQWLCCPSWNPTNISIKQEDLIGNWNSSLAESVRQSVLDGTYSYCNHKVCPLLNRLLNTDEVPANFTEKESFNYTPGLPKTLLFGFDRSCNMRCPSCRANIVPNDDLESYAYNEKMMLLNAIDSQLSKDVETIMITGSGDPIYSKVYRDYLINFDSSKYPKLNIIQLITNGVLLTEKMWNSFKAKPYIKIVDISIDAGTKETYENVTRLNGDWDALFENIKFLIKEPGVYKLMFSMVVSRLNYREMELMYNKLMSLFVGSTKIFTIRFMQITHWGDSAYTPKQITDMSVFDPSHMEFEDFKRELRKIHGKPHVQHNFNHLLTGEQV